MRTIFNPSILRHLFGSVFIRSFVGKYLVDYHMPFCQSPFLNLLFVKQILLENQLEMVKTKAENEAKKVALLQEQLKEKVCGEYCEVFHCARTVTCL